MDCASLSRRILRLSRKKPPKSPILLTTERANPRRPRIKTLLAENSQLAWYFSARRTQASCAPGGENPGCPVFLRPEDLSKLGAWRIISRLPRISPPRGPKQAGHLADIIPVAPYFSAQRTQASYPSGANPLNYYLARKMAE